MSKYPALIAALQQERALSMAYLVRLDFASETTWLWDGFGDLKATDPVTMNVDQIWMGAGQLGKISDITRELVSTQEPSLSLSGVDPGFVTAARQSGAEVKGRPARIFEQYFDRETQQPIDIPVILYAGFMDKLEVSAQGPSVRAVTLRLVTLLYNRRRPAYAYLGATSQRRISPGDRGMDELPALVNKTVSWPNYS